MRDEKRLEKKQFRDRVNEIITDYLVNEPEETYCHVELWFEKGWENQHKVKTWGKSSAHIDEKNKIPCDNCGGMELFSAADLFFYGSCHKCKASIMMINQSNGEHIVANYCPWCGEPSANTKGLKMEDVYD